MPDDLAMSEYLRKQRKVDRARALATAVQESTEAMRSQNYDLVVRILSPYENELSGADKKRYEIARSRSKELPAESTSPSPIGVDAFVNMRLESKFWNIELNGKEHKVHSGTIGTAGRRTKQSFASAADAKQAFERLVEQKRKAGYAELPSAKLTDRSSFWRLISDILSRTRNLEEFEHELNKELSRMTEGDILSFAKDYGALVTDACTWDVLGSARLIGCGWSDDGFLDFRRWLVFQGKDVFEAVLHDAEFLATYDRGANPVEQWYTGYHPATVYGYVSQKEFPYSEVSCGTWDLPEGADPYRFDNKIRARFPKLWKRIQRASMR